VTGWVDGAVRWAQLKSWLTASLPALGGVGLILAAFVDSSFLALPLVTDLMLIELSGRHPLRMPYYVALAVVGSVAGNLCIYYPARKGGEAYYRAKQSQQPGRIRRLVEKYPFACVFLPALAPFPVPIKPFVIAQGVFGVPPGAFVVGTVAGRACRFSCEAFLGVRYGAAAKRFLFTQKWVLVAAVVAILFLFLLTRLPIFNRKYPPQTD